MIHVMLISFTRFDGEIIRVRMLPRRNPRQVILVGKATETVSTTLSWNAS